MRQPYITTEDDDSPNTKKSNLSGSNNNSPSNQARVIHTPSKNSSVNKNRSLKEQKEALNRDPLNDESNFNLTNAEMMANLPSDDPSKDPKEFVIPDLEQLGRTFDPTEPITWGLEAFKEFMTTTELGLVLRYFLERNAFKEEEFYVPVDVRQQYHNYRARHTDNIQYLEDIKARFICTLQGVDKYHKIQFYTSLF